MGARPVDKPSVVQFNVPLSSAKNGDFYGADEPAFVLGTGTPKTTGKISIAVDVPLMAPVSNCGPFA